MMEKGSVCLFLWFHNLCFIYHLGQCFFIVGWWFCVGDSEKSVELIVIVMVVHSIYGSPQVLFCSSVPEVASASTFA